MIAFLLHHANRCTKMPEFYAIKDRLLGPAEVLGYDIQHIEGKKCYSCNGTGQHHKYDRNGFIYATDSCWNCYGGWFKRPMWILLVRKKYGKYVFHRPVKREYSVKNPFIPSHGDKIIDGYIEHRYGRYNYLAVLLLFLIYNRQAFKKYFHEMGMGWRTYWWYPQNWLYVVAHYVRHGRDACPLRDLRKKIQSRTHSPHDPDQWRKNFHDHYFGPGSDLPF